MMRRCQDSVFRLGAEDVPLEEVMFGQKQGEAEWHRSHVVM